MDTVLRKKLQRNVHLDYIAIFIERLNMQSSIWVLYLAWCGLNLGQIGILEGLYHITSMVFEIPSGAIADLLGRKKSIILSRICITLSCFIMLFFRNFWMFALSFIIQALGNNFISGSEEALIYDSLKAVGEEDRFIGISGKDQVIIEISCGIATVTGGILAEYSYFCCYAACLAVSLLAFFPVFFMTEAPFEKTVSTEGSLAYRLINHFKTSFAILRADRRIFRIVVYYETVFAAHTLLFFYSQQYFSNLGHNKIAISIFMLAFSVCSCIGALVSDRVFARFGKKLSFVAALITGICIFLFYFDSTWISVAALSTSGLFISMLYPVQSATLNSLISSEQRATLISVNSMFFSIAMIVLFPAAGFIADTIGLSYIFAGIGTILIAFTLLWSRKI